jgi:hypothetical protein
MDEIEIATWRPAPFAKPPDPAQAPSAEIEFSLEEDKALAEAASAPNSLPAPPRPGPEIPRTETGPPADSAGAAGPSGTEESSALSAAPPEPARPTTLEEARERIRSAGDREAVADAALSYIQPFFPLVALLIARKNDVIGWQVRAPAASRSAFRAARIPFDEPSIFLNVRLSGAPYQGPLPDLPSHAPILEAFGTRPDHCAIFPVFLRKRIVAFLFIEHTGAALPKKRLDDENLPPPSRKWLAA